jgi:hypothetical protein
MIDTALLQDEDIKMLLKDASEKAHTSKDLTYIFQYIPLEVYGLLQFSLSSYPSLKKLIPPMPTKDEQVKWTGTCNTQLLNTAVTYVKSLIMHTTTLGKNHSKDILFLDHGCGWGRLPRFISKFIPSKQIFGLDPMQQSIDICKRDRVPGTYQLCNPYPDYLPIKNQKFDLINCFSVFTHLSEKYQFKVLETLRQYISIEGVFAASIRRESFWSSQNISAKTKRDLIAKHRKYGFAHISGSKLGCEADEPFFGDTSISLDYVKNNWKGWRLITTDINILQPAQIVLFLRPS